MPIKYFDHIDFKNLENYYSKDITLDTMEIEIDLNFENKILHDTEIDRLDFALKNLRTLIQNAWKWLEHDYYHGVDVNEYVSIHLEDFFEEDPEEILAGTDPSLNNEQRFLQTLGLSRIGFYPDSDVFIVMDFMTYEELSNYILVVNLNKNFKLLNITIES